MIITQQIINGVCSVTKTGSYFNLISAGGVVRVKLTKNGSTVLDSKMWVGMNLDKAQPFDEVEIYGADGPIEFWAGDVSMQMFMSSNAGAKAIRTDKKFITETQLVTSADITRQSVRLRADEEIYVGGAGVTGDGWRLTPGVITEIPLAGSIYAYRMPPIIDIGMSVFLENINNFWSASNGGAPGISKRLVLDSGAVKLQQGDFYLEIDTGSGWIRHPDLGNVSASDAQMFFSRNRAEVFYWRTNGGNLALYRSKDFGRTFKSVLYDAGSPVASGGAMFGVDPAYEQGGWLTITSISNKAAVVINMDSGEFEYVDFSAWDYVYKAIMLENGTLMVSGDNGSGGGIYHYVDNNWVKLKSLDAARVFFGSSGNIIGRSNTGRWQLSSDYGQTWFENADIVARQEPQAHCNYLQDGIWLTCNDQEIGALHIQDGAAVYQQIGTDPASGSGVEAFYSGIVQIDYDGKVYRGAGSTSGNYYASIYQLNTDKTLKPVSLEVMELLA